MTLFVSFGFGRGARYASFVGLGLGASPEMEVYDGDPFFRGYAYPSLYNGAIFRLELREGAVPGGTRLIEMAAWDVFVPTDRDFENVAVPQERSGAVPEPEDRAFSVTR